MAIERTGTLVPKRSGWHARIWVDVIGDDGVPRKQRRWVPLGTHDRELAARKLAKIVKQIAAGEVIDVRKEAAAPETVADFLRAHVERRRAAGVVQARDEANNLERYIVPEIGRLALTEVRPVNIRKVLANAVDRGLSRETIKKIRGVMFRGFDAAWKAEQIADNPVARVDIPDEARQDDRPRAILSDEEILSFLTSAEVPMLYKVLASCARVLGGMRTSELNRWDWAMLERETYATVRIRRAKAKRGHTGKVQTLIVPEQMRPILAAWHQSQGAPPAGPVFPVQHGKNAGGFRSRYTTYAHVLRKYLLRAGVTRHEIHNDTPVSRRADFHSFRRAFNTALAEAGVNVQTAMHLASHSDAKVHSLYIMQTEAMQRITPAAALPLLNASIVIEAPAGDSSSATVENHTTATVLVAVPAIAQACAANDVCREALGFEGRRSIQLSYGRVYETTKDSLTAHDSSVTGGDSSSRISLGSWGPSLASVPRDMAAVVAELAATRRAAEVAP